MEIQIKRFKDFSLEQLYQILKLRVDVFVVEQDCPYPEIDNLDQQAIHVFIDSQEEIIGYLRIYKKAQNEVGIGRVITHVNYRKKGISRKLMEAALDYIKNEKISDAIYLQAQDHLINFYMSFGFLKKSDPYLEDGIPHVDMTLDLS